MKTTPLCHLLCLGIHSNVMLRFMVRALQDPPICSNTGLQISMCVPGQCLLCRRPDPSVFHFQLACQVMSRREIQTHVLLIRNKVLYQQASQSVEIVWISAEFSTESSLQYPISGVLIVENCRGCLGAFICVSNAMAAQFGLSTAIGRRICVAPS